MTKKETSTESALPDNSKISNLGIDVKVDEQRMHRYKILAAAFCYPDGTFFTHFPDLMDNKQSLMAEYDRLFRAGVVWLYGAEHLVKNEFQRANLLSDIMGFYTAFGFEPNRERPDSLACELEFMYGLILKKRRACQLSADYKTKEKIDICLEAEKKFFAQHLEPAAALIAEKMISQSEDNFYVNIAGSMLEFLASERKHFNMTTVKDRKTITKKEITDE